MPARRQPIDTDEKNDERDTTCAMSDTNETVRLPWPSGGQSLFAGDSDWWFNVCVSTVRGNRDAYARGYVRAATMLFEQISEKRHVSDTILLPIAFLWRQALELQLKDVITGTRQLAGSCADVPAHHRIRDLWASARPALEALDACLAEDLDGVGDLIQQFAAVDPGSIDFRYSTSKAGDETLAQVPDLVNIRNLHERMTELTTFFDCALCEIGVRLEYAAAAMAEMRDG